jgi:hypothetical protein
MKTFMKIWGCVILTLGIPLIYITAAIERYDLVVLNCVMIGVGLYGTWNVIQILEEKDKQ